MLRSHRFGGVLEAAVSPTIIRPPRLFFFFKDKAHSLIYTLSLHDALPISPRNHSLEPEARANALASNPPVRDSATASVRPPRLDRKSTRLNSSHSQISYAVFCLKKKRKQRRTFAAYPTSTDSNNITSTRTT